MNTINLLKPRKALNKAFLKVKANRNEIETFKSNLIVLLDRINESESEEFHKNLVSNFLTNTYYSSTNFINTKGRNDLVIHNGNSASATVGVIVEAKKPTNKSEMISVPKAGSSGGGINAKAFQELVLYYLRERITQKNLEIKHLVATNIYEWFIFDANLFEKEFAQNKHLVQQFTDFEEGRLSGKTTDFFYKQIAEPAIEAITHEISFTWFDIRDYEKPLRNNDKKDDNILIALYKLLSPEHLLKLPFANDSNSLDKSFYTELLHIIGLTETKEGGKKLIQRKKEGERNSGSLIESAIFQLDNLEKISRLPKPSQFGETNQERLFNVALELSITWINRILFLKLLEAQLIKYHKGDKSFSYLNIDKVQNLDDLNNLFFGVLARKPNERSEEVKKIFANVPFLNSSLFEPTEVEQTCFFISQLKDGKLPLLPSTVIKDNNGNKRTGQLLIIEYIFEFLNAYDFASEGSEEIQEDNKRLINASVLGLIFEKINGYKDGSFFTPGFITMYMCRETIRRAVVQKFNETKKWDCEDLAQVYDKIEDRKEANTIVNSFKICDPAVGSGHFLVSALNEMIAIKSDLKILNDRDGKRLKEYSVEVENDELVVTDDDGELFGYYPLSKESQRIQETLFHEKQTIIENCLFGVDINPNSVKICRLRLWIELLKNAYYRKDNTNGISNELETLPNIDINIKCGNSLISRFPLDADIKKALKKSKWSIDSYRLAVMTYRNAQSKEEKRSMERMINGIKNDFESEIAANDNRLLKLNKAKGELLALTMQTSLYEQTKAEKTIWNKQVNGLTNMITLLETEIEEIKSNKIYENAFEWRFEFPEVLNDEGEFIGFDVILGNPPYGVLEKERNSALEPYQNIMEYCEKTSRYELVEGGKLNLYRLFIFLSFQIANKQSWFGFIVPMTLLGDISLKSTRTFVMDYFSKMKIDCFPQKDIVNKRVFEDAKQSTLILTSHIQKNNHSGIDNFIVRTFPYNSFEDEFKQFITNKNEILDFDKNGLNIPMVNEAEWKILQRIHQNKSIGEFSEIVVRRGEINQTIFRKYISENSKHENLIKGVEVGKYLINKTLSQGKKEYLDEVMFSIDGKINPQKPLRRIVTQRITGVDEKYRIVATITPPNSHYADSTNSIHLLNDELITLEYILGLLNSKLYQWRFKKTSSNNNVGTNEIESLPFKIDSKFSKKVISIVSCLLTFKSEDSKADTTALEAELDQLVYQLYGLTEEEIKIVEGA